MAESNKKSSKSDKSLENTIKNAHEPVTHESLKKFNRNAGIVHLIQGLLMVFLGTILEFSRIIYVNYVDFVFDEETLTAEVLPSPSEFLTLEAIGILVGSFLLLSAIFHLLIAFPLNKKYREFIDRGINPLRWLEYSLSSSIMIVIIAIFFSILDFWLLVAIFFLNWTMIMFGLMMELHNEYTEKVHWVGFILGCISGIIPWIIITAYFYGVSSNTGEGPPDFVYYIYWTQAILFNSFALNMVLQYKKVGPWKQYIFGERVYIILSLAAKTILAWIVFAGVFQPD